ncbi:hypothetical protein AX16_008598 [Volvariella volvacea WC 439]|nr:hypothetical protein AX16_008598 [Volvariella volvacea WC 439]
MPKAQAKPKPQPQVRRRRATSDPLTAALLPPENETLEQREHRLQVEYEAKRISDSIDEMLRQDRKKSRQAIRVLLLGQSESGKTTTLKQFQLLHSPSAFHAERIAWRAVIYLNLVQSIRKILEALSPENEADGLHDEHEDDFDCLGLETANVIITASGRPPDAILDTRVPKYESYKRRLAPLAALEERLIRLLSCPDEEEAIRLPPSASVSTSNLSTMQYSQSPASPYQQPPPYEYSPYSEVNTYVVDRHHVSSNPRQPPNIIIPSNPQLCYPSPVSPTVENGSGIISSPSSYTATNGTGSHISTASSKAKEIAVHSFINWKKAFSLRSKASSPKSARSGEIQGWWEDPDDPAHTLYACANAMYELWKDPHVQRTLREKEVRLEESSGFYLHDIMRITALKYIPTDADILKARLKTTGALEHSFTITTGDNRGAEWIFYDVGGTRNQRQAWAPYFEDVNAIIFLAPISAFDQFLAEDPTVNRLEDSLLLWKAVVSNKLLAKVNIVLFLNKCDLLQAKLEAGVKLNQHMPSYGDRSNDYKSVSHYFRNKFGALHQSFTPNRERELFIHFTTVTDTTRTQVIIHAVRDIIIKCNLRSLRLV